MATRHIQSQPLPRSWQSLHRRLTYKLEQSALVQVLDNFPLVNRFIFEETTLFDKRAKCIRLGFRTDINGVKATSYAYVLAERGEMVPHIVIRDELPSRLGSGRRLQMFPRAATSLLRKAEDLYNPFCFLQFEPHDRPSNIRGMLCAIILYYFLIAGLDDGAIRWDEFETSFLQALQYIQGRPEYQRWIAEQLDDSNITVSKETPDHEFSMHENENDNDNDVSHTPTGGTVRSKGSLLQVTPNTALGELYRILGNRIYFLDSLSSALVTFEHHTVFPLWFAYRLLFGTYRDINVYIYHTPYNKIRIMGHDATGEEAIFAFNTLNEITLFEPFASLIRFGYQDSTLREYMRSMLYYYFVLAEHEGIIADPRLKLTGNKAQYLAFACKKQGKTARNTNPRYRQWPVRREVIQRERAFEEEPVPRLHNRNELEEERRVMSIPKWPLIVTLRVKPDILAALARVTHAPITNVTLDSQSEQGKMEELVEAEGRQHIISDGEDQYFVEPEVLLDCTRDRSSDSSSAPLAPPTLKAELNAVAQQLSPKISGNEPPIRRGESKDSDSSSAGKICQHVWELSDSKSQAEDIPDEQQGRAASVISISSSITNDTPSNTPPSASPRTLSPAPLSTPDQSHVIDLCSDSDDDNSVILDPSKHEIEATTERDKVLATHRGEVLSRRDEELRWPAQWGAKRKSIVIDDSDEDEELEMVDGDGWRRASLGHARR
jgi:hypothetical protein